MSYLEAVLGIALYSGSRNRRSVVCSEQPFGFENQQPTRRDVWWLSPVAHRHLWFVTCGPDLPQPHLTAYEISACLELEREPEASSQQVHPRR